MEFLKPILENPFHKLGASPLDDRSKLIELGNQASQPGGNNVGQSLNILLDDWSRLEAEINWFPNTPPAQAEAVVNYPLSGEPVSFPELCTNSALAQFNACRVLLEAWPASDADGIVAFCRSMIGLDSAIQPDLLMAEINADREKSCFPPLQDPARILYLLTDVRRSTAHRIIDRIKAQPKIRLDSILNSIARLYKEYPSPLIEIMIRIYESSIEDQIGKAAHDLDPANIFDGAVSESALNSMATSICDTLRKWQNLTDPMRTLDAQKGIVSKNTQLIFRNTHEIAMILFSKHSRLDASRTIISGLLDTFGYIPEIKMSLTKDLAALELIKNQAILRMMNR